MFSPKLMERVVGGQQNDRLHEAEMARLFRKNKSGSSSTTVKLGVVVSGTALIALMLVQMLVI